MADPYESSHSGAVVDNAVSVIAPALKENNSIWIGSDPSSTTSTASNNTALGINALDAITTADDTTAIGKDSLSAATTSPTNTAVGAYAGENVSTGNGQGTFVGANAGEEVTTGAYNTAVGYNAGGGASGSAATGDSNTSVGHLALEEVTSGHSNTAVGKNAMLNATEPTYATALGFAALQNTTAGSGNVAVGGFSMQNNTTGDRNVAVGYLTLDANQQGDRNTAVGYQALTGMNPSGNADTYNSAFGHRSMAELTTGTANTALGFGTLENATVANNCVVVGGGAGQRININSEPDGHQNTLVGYAAGDVIESGQKNLCLGYGTDTSAADSDFQIVIGYGIVGGGDNTVRIGTSTGNATLSLDGSDTSWAAASDSRLKTEVADSTAGLSFITDLRPVTFKWDAKNAIDPSLSQYDPDDDSPVMGVGNTNHGIIAQEVKAAIDAHSEIADGHNIWSEDPDGTQQLAQGNLVPMLVKAIQEQQVLIESLTARIAALES